MSFKSIINMKKNAEVYKEQIDEANKKNEELKSKIAMTMFDEEKKMLVSEKDRRETELEELKSSYSEKRAHIYEELKKQKAIFEKEIEIIENRKIYQKAYDSFLESKKKKETELNECTLKIKELQGKINSSVEKSEELGYDLNVASIAKKLEEQVAYKTYLNEEIEELNSKIKSSIVIEKNMEKLKYINYLKVRLPNLSYDNLEDWYEIEKEEFNKVNANKKEENTQEDVEDEIEEIIEEPIEKSEDKPESEILQNTAEFEFSETSKPKESSIKWHSKLTQEQIEELIEENIMPGNSEYIAYLWNHGISPFEDSKGVSKDSNLKNKASKTEDDKEIEKQEPPIPKNVGSTIEQDEIVKQEELAWQEHELKLRFAEDIEKIREEKEEDYAWNEYKKEQQDAEYTPEELLEEEQAKKNFLENKIDEKSDNSYENIKISRIEIDSQNKTMKYYLTKEVNGQKIVTQQEKEGIDYSREYFNSDEIKNILNNCQAELGDSYKLDAISKMLDPNILELIDGDKEILNQYVKSIYSYSDSSKADLPFSIQYDLTNIRNKMNFNERHNIRRVSDVASEFNNATVKEDLKDIWSDSSFKESPITKMVNKIKDVINQRKTKKLSDGKHLESLPTRIKNRISKAFEVDEEEFVLGIDDEKTWKKQYEAKHLQTENTKSNNQQENDYASKGGFIVKDDEER